MIERRVCSIEGCERPHKARGWCPGHYSRWLATGEVRPELPLGGNPDAVECTCAAPAPDAIGECRRCRRLVVTDEVIAKAKAWREQQAVAS